MFSGFLRILSKKSNCKDHKCNIKNLKGRLVYTFRWVKTGSFMQNFIRFALVFSCNRVLGLKWGLTVAVDNKKPSVYQMIEPNCHHYMDIVLKG